ncbi:hypothetical protein P7K49_020945 [Saguinus oedipus]|uniref:Dynein regulatory complex protein 12 n=1 Tax=Saguinus oedipus TaxID=9490 RepID=A0ABQ9URA9_SAGOE|nr:hypothetical protein P7K49_020945 [Saguinus oedipus]
MAGADVETKSRHRLVVLEKELLQDYLTHHSLPYLSGAAAFTGTVGKLVILRESGMSPLEVPFADTFGDWSRVECHHPALSSCPPLEAYQRETVALREEAEKALGESDQALAQLQAHVADMEAKYEEILHMSTTPCPVPRTPPCPQTPASMMTDNPGVRRRSISKGTLLYPEDRKKGYNHVYWTRKACKPTWGSPTHFPLSSWGLKFWCLQDNLDRLLAMMRAIKPQWDGAALRLQAQGAAMPVWTHPLDL